jgi:Trk K+ transport system NAD-binding subunit
LFKAHPDWDYTLFVRNEERAKPIKAAYPNTKFVYGTLTDSAVIEKAAAEADIVIRTYSCLAKRIQ